MEKTNFNFILTKKGVPSTITPEIAALLKQLFTFNLN